MPPRYRREVGPDDVGRRVSVRRWITDAERGRVPSDVVGRLVSWSDDVLEIRTRDGTLVRVVLADVLGSRTVPEHPRLPPEAHS